MAVTPDRHPEAEQLARYTDDSLPANERAEIERHLGVCADCRDTVADTIAFLQIEREAEAAEESAGTPPLLPAKPVEPLPFRARPRWVAVAGITGSIAALFLLVLLIPRNVAQFGAGEVPPRRELDVALVKESRRPTEGRLVEFRYAPAPSPTRGNNDRNVSPDVRIAAARIEQLAKAEDTPANREALGIAYLALGKIDEGIDAIENAVQRERQNAIFQSDLAAALLLRAKWYAQADDWIAALTAADRAIALDPKRREAYFNRALALQGLNRTDEAVQAWEAYQRLDTSGPWFDESVRHLEQLRGR